MRFTNAPRAIPMACYDEAAREYARSAGRRALAIYRVGACSQDGISDLDLLVVPRRVDAEGGRWFSARNHLPPRLRAPFRHDPDLLPPGHVDVLRFTTHSQRSLLFGEDVAAGVRCAETPEQRWAMLFERLCAIDRFHEKTRKRRRADLWKLLSRAKSVGTSLTNLDILVGSQHGDRFGADLAALRAGFFRLEPAEAGAACWELFDRGHACLTSALTAALGLDARTSPVEFGTRFLHGDASIPGLTEVDLAERRAAVLRVQRAAFELGCGGADLFTALPYTARIKELERATRPPAWRRLARVAVVAARDARLRIDDGLAKRTDRAPISSGDRS